MEILVGAWHAIRRNAETSRSQRTREEARQFGHNLPQQLKKIQGRLKFGYQFAPAFGATPEKGIGKPGKRPLVIAPLDDRIVQRALLDVLQDANDLPSVQAVLKTPRRLAESGGVVLMTLSARLKKPTMAGHVLLRVQTYQDSLRRSHEVLSSTLFSSRQMIPSSLNY
jgi:hypothetical protein